MSTQKGKNMKTKLSVGIVLCFLSVSVFAVNVDTVKTFSVAMQKEISAIVITPSNYSPDRHYPVVYLLHGYSGNYRAWASEDWGVKYLTDTYDLIIVSPDGGYSSWYFDSPIDANWRYETYISRELVTFIDTHYSTIVSPKGRAITGLSMGGHGGLYLAFRNQDVFGACGSMSGGVDIRPFPLNWDIAKRLGVYAENSENWEKHTVINLTHLLTPNSLAIIIDCGTADFFYDVNVKLHEKLKYNNIPHDFISRPGAHNWDYWKNAVKYQMFFFDDFFRK
jgi:S-formylglutathione hydrolase FrmB